MFAVCVCACHDVLIRVGKYVATPLKKTFSVTGLVVCMLVVSSEPEK